MRYGCSWPQGGALACDPVVNGNLLPPDHPGCHSSPSPGVPRYPFINQLIREDEQPDELHASCPWWDLNLDLLICSQAH